MVLSVYYMLCYVAVVEQGVTLMGRNTTGPTPRAASWWVTLHMHQCYRRRQTSATVTSLTHGHCV